MELVSSWRTRRGVPHHIRTRIVGRDNGVCQLGYPGCTYYAVEIDHIEPVATLGLDHPHQPKP